MISGRVDLKSESGSWVFVPAARGSFAGEGAPTTLAAVSQGRNQQGAIDLLGEGNLQIGLREQKLHPKGLQPGSLGSALGAFSLQGRQHGLTRFPM